MENKADFDDQLKAAREKLMVVYFYDWCGPCKMIEPVLKEMAKDMDDVVFLKVDVDECDDIAEEYSITAMPTFVYHKSQANVSELQRANIDKLTALEAEHRRPRQFMCLLLCFIASVSHLHAFI